MLQALKKSTRIAHVARKRVHRAGEPNDCLRVLLNKLFKRLVIGLVFIVMQIYHVFSFYQSNTIGFSPESVISFDLFTSM